ncbi:hypothetical protein PF004_g14433 [Phytophthora fragariae]|uniref:Protein kinase domain-containing protein n=1 Tax=Phytophthora fragariae TaxID=53985 RepID=A0A6G0NP69_9STRA|nr:hypothetical protein PF004_g14433 [Phytophthora fragariae]
MGNIFRRVNRRMEFISAVSEGDLKRVQKRIRYVVEEDKEYGLNVAARCGHLEVDANLNVSKALVEAASSGHMDVVQYLAERCDADVNAKDEAGRTALVWAAYRDDTRLTRYLVEQCAVDVSAEALVGGVGFGNLNVVRYFVEECGADVNMEDEHGQTAVMEAVKTRKIDVLRYLVEECSVDVNSTAVRFAADWGYIDIERILTPFLHPEAGDTTKDVVLSSDIPSGCSIPPSEIELTLFHENGSIGGDFLAKWLGSDVVVKLPIPDASSTSFEGDVRLWQQLRHPNVLKMYGACDAGPHLKLFVCEYASNGSLLEHVTSSSVEKRTMWKYLYEAALGLEYLHERGIVHAELRCSNISIGSDAGSVYWQSPEVMSGYPPSCVARELLWGIIRHDPDQRTSLSSVVYQLGNLAIKESSDSAQPENEPIISFNEYERGNMNEDWLGLERLMTNPNNAQHCREFSKLKKVREHLQASPQYPTFLHRFHELLDDFTKLVKISPEQARLMQLSSTCATINSLYAFQWRIQSLMASLGEMGEVATEGEARWQQQRNEQIEQFISGVSDTFLLINALKTVEERSAFLNTLKEEMKTTSKYTTEQLDVMKKAYEDVTSKLEGDNNWSELAPAWFIPWYELVVDEWSKLGEGGFGSVHRAKWLDSDVVVKRLDRLARPTL